jgi:hypothetical protein
MTYFKVTEFNGIAPVIAPRLLADGVAQTAENVVLNSGRAVLYQLTLTLLLYRGHQEPLYGDTHQNLQTIGYNGPLM